MQRRGVRVTVVSTISTQPPMVADELRRQADVFLDIVELQPKIGRDPAERAAREAREPREPREPRQHTPQFLQRGPAPQRAGAAPTTTSTTENGASVMPARRERPDATARAVRASLPSGRNGAPASPPGTTLRCPRSARSSARLLIVGLAPGLHGANRTGRPFTGDYSGVLLYDTLTRYGFRGRHLRRPAR